MRLGNGSARGAYNGRSRTRPDYAMQRHPAIVSPRRHLAFLAAMLVGCAQEVPGDPPALEAGAPSTRSHSIEAFGFIDGETTVPQVFAKLGYPIRDIGSGIHIYEYRLQDGSSVTIGSPDGSDIWYVRHGNVALFQQN